MQLTGRLLFWLVCLMVGSAVAGAYVPGCVLPAPSITLPGAVSGEPGDLLTVTAVTNGSQVHWATAGSLQVVELTGGKTVLIVAKQPGDYRLLAWTAAHSKPSEAAVCQVHIAGPGPVPPGPVPPGPVPPGPVPPWPPPGPQPPVPPIPPPDTLVEALQAAYDGDQTAGKAQKVVLLATFFRLAASEVVYQPGITTTDQLDTTMHNGATAFLADGIMPVRKAIRDELDKKIGTQRKQLDQATRDLIAGQFKRVADALGGIKG